MRIFVAGGTGVIGKRVVERLVGLGHDVTAVARTGDKARFVTEFGATPLAVDLFDPAALSEAVRGHEVVFNLATSIPPGASALWKSAWTTNHRIRREASANLAGASRAAGVSRLIQESITLIYGDGGDEPLDEEAPLAPTWITTSALEAEANAMGFSAGGGVSVVLRFATFYGPDGAHSIDMIGAARSGKALAIGPKGAYTSSIHIDDAATAAVAALDAPVGVYNVSDDEPLRREDYFHALGTAVGRSRLWYPPTFLGRLGGPKLDMLFRSHRVSSSRFKAATGWHPSHPSAREGWPSVVAEMQGDSEPVISNQ